MKYFYTGASESGATQQDPELSLGGKISSSPIPNDMLQNIFSAASYLSVQQKKRETKLIALQNDDATKTATGLSLDFDLNSSSQVKYKIAFVEPNSQDCFEEIINSAALPFEASFDDVVEGTPVSLPDLAPGKYLGIWLSRSYDFASDDLKPKDCTYYKDQLTTPTVPDTQDSLDLILNYTLV